MVLGLRTHEGSLGGTGTGGSKPHVLLCVVKTKNQ